MKSLSLFLLGAGIVLVISRSQSAETSKKDEVQFSKALHDELESMQVEDQRVRRHVFSTESKEEIEERKRVDQAHQKRIKEIITQYGWPGRSLVGKDGAGDAWLLVQHSRVDFQAECLPLMERAVVAGEAEAKDYAYLVDRVRSDQDKPQIYGTQFDEKYELCPISEHLVEAYEDALVRR